MREFVPKEENEAVNWLIVTSFAKAFAVRSNHPQTVLQPFGGNLLHRAMI